VGPEAAPSHHQDFPPYAELIRLFSESLADNSSIFSYCVTLIVLVGLWRMKLEMNRQPDR
ncbi:hypothetical protein AVEN_119722-1, partial [Araneus ventricosus]